MSKLYISIDVETSGPAPWKYSMLALGACVVGDTSKQFYAELQPRSYLAVTPALKVSTLGLRSLDHFRYLPEFDPRKPEFSAQTVLQALMRRAREPNLVMTEFAEWVKTVAVGFEPIECAAPSKFDGSFTTYYFSEYYSEENPFGHRGEDIASLYRGVTGNLNARLEDLGLRKNGLPHNALEDAIIQAKEMEAVLALMKK